MSAPEVRPGPLAPQRLLEALRALPKAETALWAPAMLVAALTLADYVALLRAEADLRIAASRAAVALAAHGIDPPQAEAMVRRELRGHGLQALSVSVSMGDRAAVEVRLPAESATLFGFHWVLPGDELSARAEAVMQVGLAEAELVRPGAGPA